MSEGDIKVRLCVNVIYHSLVVEQFLGVLTAWTAGLSGMPGLSLQDLLRGEYAMYTF